MSRAGFFTLSANILNRTARAVLKLCKSNFKNCMVSWQTTLNKAGKFQALFRETKLLIQVFGRPQF